MISVLSVALFTQKYLWLLPLILNFCFISCLLFHIFSYHLKLFPKFCLAVILNSHLTTSAILCSLLPPIHSLQAFLELFSAGLFPELPVLMLPLCAVVVYSARLIQSLDLGVLGFLFFFPFLFLNHVFACRFFTVLSVSADVFLTWH